MKHDYEDFDDDCVGEHDCCDSDCDNYEGYCGDDYDDHDFCDSDSDDY